MLKIKFLLLGAEFLFGAVNMHRAISTGKKVAETNFARKLSKRKLEEKK